MNANATKCHEAELRQALAVLGMSKDMAGNAARADWLKARGIRVPKLYGDTIVVIARAALAV